MHFFFTGIKEKTMKELSIENWYVITSNFFERSWSIKLKVKDIEHYDNNVDEIIS